jgi:hypothetical protein
MPGSKIKEAKNDAFVENQLCTTLWEDYGKAVEAAAKQGVAADKDDDAKKALGKLKTEYSKFESKRGLSATLRGGQNVWPAVVLERGRQDAGSGAGIRGRSYE